MCLGDSDDLRTTYRDVDVQLLSRCMLAARSRHRRVIRKDARPDESSLKSKQYQALYMHTIFPRTLRVRHTDTACSAAGMRRAGKGKVSDMRSTVHLQLIIRELQDVALC